MTQILLNTWFNSKSAAMKLLMLGFERSDSLLHILVTVLIGGGVALFLLVMTSKND